MVALPATRAKRVTRVHRELNVQAADVAIGAGLAGAAGAAVTGLNGPATQGQPCLRVREQHGRIEVKSRG